MKKIYRQSATELKLQRMYEFSTLLQPSFSVAYLVAYFSCGAKALIYNGL